MSTRFQFLEELVNLPILGRLPGAGCGLDPIINGEFFPVTVFQNGKFLVFGVLFVGTHSDVSDSFFHGFGSYFW